MRKAIAMLTAAMIAGAAAGARATSLVATDLRTLSRLATTIVRGVVVSVDTRWAEGHRAVESVVTLEPETYLKGSLGPTIELVVPGGLLGRYRSIVVGAPTFAAGQRVVLFLGAHGFNEPHLIGLGQSVFRVENAMVTPPALLLPSGDAAVQVVRGDPTRRSVSLAEFERQVRSLAAGQP